MRVFLAQLNAMNSKMTKEPVGLKEREDAIDIMKQKLTTKISQLEHQNQ
jgi:hypothetical protein